MTMFNQSQVKDLVVSTVAAVAGVSAEDGRKVIFCKETNQWYYPTGTGTVDNVAILQGAGTKWAVVKAKAFPAPVFDPAVSYAKGDVVTWMDRYIISTDATSPDTKPTIGKWAFMFTTSSSVFDGWDYVFAAAGENIYVEGAVYQAKKPFNGDETAAQIYGDCIPVAPSAAVLDYTSSYPYAKGQLVKYKTLIYRTSKTMASAPATPSLKADGSGDLEIALERIQSTKAIAAANGELADVAANSAYICKDQYDGSTTQTVYRYYIGTLTAVLTEAVTGLTNLRILSANFHVETFLGEARTGTKAYDEFITHNNDGDESRVRAISEDGTKLQIQQGTNIKIVGGWIDFAGTKSGWKTRTDLGL